jgi:hypothetical protein
MKAVPARGSVELRKEPAGREEDGQVGPILAQPVSELRAADAGHDDVGDEDIEGFAGGVELEGLLGGRRRDDGVAGPAEHAGGEVADGGVVLDEEDPGDGRLGRGGMRQGRVLGGPGPVGEHGGAATRRALDADAGAELLDGAVHRGEAEAAALLPGGEEGRSRVAWSMPAPVSTTRSST